MSALLDPHMVIAFSGTELPAETRAELERHEVAGVTLFRHDNVDHPGQVRRLTAALQETNRSDLPLLIAGDQETGQLQGLGGTPFAGNMALGAVGDPALTRRVARAVGLELRAMGVNVDYAPVCDVVTIPENPSLGIRSFGDRPHDVAAMTAAFTQGLRESGVVPVLKHFPGKGDAAVDPHHGLPVLFHDVERLRAVEFPPFASAMAAGASMVMVGHYGLPAITGDPSLPSSLSSEVIDGLIRSDLGFDGVVITDALDMGGLTESRSAPMGVLDALAAGVDLLLFTPVMTDRDGVRAAVDAGASSGRVDPGRLARSRARIERLRCSVDRSPPPDLDVVGCRDHLELAREVARRSVTLIRDRFDVLPLRLDPGARLLALMPEPTDLTPADTSSLVEPAIGAALRRHHGSVTEIVMGREPSPSDISSLVDGALRHDAVVVGTINAGRSQAALVAALQATGRPLVTVALRDPFDLGRYPGVDVHLATYSIHRESLDALADVIFGATRATGRLPVAAVDGGA